MTNAEVLHQVCKKGSKSDFQVNYFYQELSKSFQFLCTIDNDILGAYFLLEIFFYNSKFWNKLFFIIMPNFWRTVIHFIQVYLRFWALSIVLWNLQKCAINVRSYLYTTLMSFLFFFDRHDKRRGFASSWAWIPNANTSGMSPCALRHNAWVLA